MAGISPLDVKDIFTKMMKVIKADMPPANNPQPTTPATSNADWSATSGPTAILNKPAIPAAQVCSDWSSSGGMSYIMNKPVLSAVAKSGSYTDLTGTPAFAQVAFSGSYSDLSGKPAIPAAQVNSDWSASSGVSAILNKPSFSAVATSGAYSDLSGRPTIPAAQVSSDWTASSGISRILNKPTLAAVATSGSYNDLTNKPTIPGTYSFATPTSRAVALSTAYQATDATKAVYLTITLESTSSVSLSGSSNNSATIVIGSTSQVASGTGQAVATYKNILGGTLVVGLNLTSNQANTYTVALPAGWYFAIRQTVGTGLVVTSVFEQVVG